MSSRNNRLLSTLDLHSDGGNRCTNLWLVFEKRRGREKRRLNNKRWANKEKKERELSKKSQEQQRPHHWYHKIHSSSNYWDSMLQRLQGWWLGRGGSSLSQFNTLTSATKKKNASFVSHKKWNGEEEERRAPPLSLHRPADHYISSCDQARKLASKDLLCSESQEHGWTTPA